MSGTPALESTSAPLLGQHTEEICRELLKMSDEEIKRLIDEDVLHDPESSKGAGGGMFG
jgi:crotonobetainyl-CoA:carnitine CoA-transferase CaiB-like acyl-CoA transferase